MTAQPETEHHAMIRSSVIARINQYWRDGDIRGLEAYLEQIHISGKLCASVAEGPNDRNYVTAHAITIALHTCLYSSYAAQIEEILCEKRR
jgi:hypothetical protein